MNINMTLLAIMILICSILELVLMYTRKAFKLLILSIVFIILSYFFEALAVVSLFIKVVFYYRYWNDKPVRKLFYIQLVLILFTVLISGTLLLATSNM